MRDWDAQSLHADSSVAGQFFPPVGAGVPGAGSSGSPGATVEYLRDLVQKRIITLTYTRNVHDGYVLTYSRLSFTSNLFCLPLRVPSPFLSILIWFLALRPNAPRSLWLR